MSLEVVGMQKVMNNIKKLELKVGEKLEKKALNTGVDILEGEIKREANRIPDNGTLYKNIKSTRVKNGRVTVHTGEAYHAHLVEFGRSIGQTTFVDKNSIEQPIKWGTEPQPVIQGSFERKRNEIFYEMAKVIKKELNL